ncbi:21718_t:CDS:1, partial [Gigaspora rosea]
RDLGGVRILVKSDFGGAFAGIGTFVESGFCWNQDFCEVEFWRSRDLGFGEVRIFVESDFLSQGF